jgi:hypothetical protein
MLRDILLAPSRALPFVAAAGLSAAAAGGPVQSQLGVRTSSTQEAEKGN